MSDKHNSGAGGEAEPDPKLVPETQYAAKLIRGYVATGGSILGLAKLAQISSTQLWEVDKFKKNARTKTIRALCRAFNMTEADFRRMAMLEFGSVEERARSGFDSIQTGVLAAVIQLGRAAKMPAEVLESFAASHPDCDDEPDAADLYWSALKLAHYYWRRGAPSPFLEARDTKSNVASLGKRRAR